MIEAVALPESALCAWISFSLLRDFLTLGHLPRAFLSVALGGASLGFLAMFLEAL
jgi:hypothetical protein